jgi:hypothetical protein
MGSFDVKNRPHAMAPLRDNEAKHHYACRALITREIFKVSKKMGCPRCPLDFQLCLIAKSRSFHNSNTNISMKIGQISK